MDEAAVRARPFAALERWLAQHATRRVEIVAVQSSSFLSVTLRDAQGCGGKATVDRDVFPNPVGKSALGCAVANALLSVGRMVPAPRRTRKGRR
jgi:hypothetical protein